MSEATPTPPEGEEPPPVRQPAPVAPADLAPVAPSGWSSAIVVSTTTGTNTDGVPTGGQPAWVDVAVKNLGAGASGGFLVTLQVDGVATKSWSVASLDAGATWSQVDYSLTLAAGNHTLALVADSAGAVAESNETNNSFQRTLTWAAPGQPNLAPYQPTGWGDKLVVTSSSSGTSDAVLTAGQTGYVNWGVGNVGTADIASPFVIRLKLDGVTLVDYTVGSLPSGTFVTPNGGFAFTIPSGAHTLALVADSGGAVSESNESDNSYSRTFTWGGGTTTLLSDDFEGPLTFSAGGKWDLFITQGARTDVEWAKTKCDEYSGSYSADAVRGGSVGSTLFCTTNYPNGVGSVLDYHAWVSLQGTTSPKLRFKVRGRANTAKDGGGNSLDYIGVFAQPDGASSPSGFAWNGDLTGSWNQVEIDLTKWSSFGDLRGYSRFDLFFYFQSASNFAIGYGFRIDDVEIVFGAAADEGCCAEGTTAAPQGEVRVLPAFPIEGMRKN